MRPAPLPLVSLQTLVQDFFEKHLSVERHASRNTLLSYRDALKLFLAHAAETRRCSVDELDPQVLEVESVRAFLRWLAEDRGSSARTRNQRLAALKSFARYVATVAPEHLERCRRLREIPPARAEHPEVRYLDSDEILELVRVISGSSARRDRALLLLLYNTGARVQEAVDLDLANLRLDPIPLVTLTGKGRKQRTCPLWDRTVQALRSWIDQRGPDPGPVFLNAHGRRLGRSGVAYILARLARRAHLTPRHAPRVTPHVLRHTTAMHLLDAGVDITTLAAWLGHAQLSTTHAYVEITLRRKRQALAATAVVPEMSDGAFPEGELLQWLEALGRRPRYAQPYSQNPPSPWKSMPGLHITARSP